MEAQIRDMQYSKSPNDKTLKSSRPWRAENQGSPVRLQANGTSSPPMSSGTTGQSETHPPLLAVETLRPARCAA